MLRLRAQGMMVVLVFVAGGFACAAPADPAADNAALFYWRAFAAMPNLDEKQETALRDAAQKPDPVSEAAAKILTQGNSAMRELHRGAKCSRCVWATPLEDGAETLLPHCGKARQLARLACARARLNFQQGRPAAAIDDLADVMTLGRHLATDGLLVSVLVDYAVERLAVETAARHLGDLQPAQLQEFAARLDRLPPATTMHRAMEIEKECLLEPFIRDLSGPEGKEKAISLLKSLGDEKDPNRKALRGFSREQLLEGLKALPPVYDKIAVMMDRPPAEMKSVESLLAGVSPAARALGMGLLPAAVACRTHEVIHQTRRAMFEAPLAVVRGGPEQLKAEAWKDPYAGGPFSYEKTAPGFRLTSKTKDRDGKAIVLEVGRSESK